MDIGLREWLIVIGIIVIGGILFDGWRRMRGSRGRLKLKLDRSAAELPDDDDDPNLLGPARPAGKHQEPSLNESELPDVAPRTRQRSEPTTGDLSIDLDAPELADEPLGAADGERAARSRDKLADKPQERPAEKAEPRELPPFEEVLVINVVARHADGFKGPALVQSILESGLRFGNMDIFHRHESMAGNGEVLFSMANGVKPGTFDLEAIDGFSTRAVSFFLGLPGPRHPKQAFDLMVAAARKLSHELDGELRDEQRSVMTAQTIEHYRQRIVEFERRALMHKR
ncbi:cell division protein ZipA [Pseudomonas stutzeri]|nr:cell division protein ZipA [Stutzerimonas stutzeri]